MHIGDGQVSNFTTCCSIDTQDTVGITNVGCLRSIMEYVQQKQAQLPGGMAATPLSAGNPCTSAAAHHLPPLQSTAAYSTASSAMSGNGNGRHSAASSYHHVPVAHPDDAPPSWLQPKVTLSVEGNISAGKSTFLRILEAQGLLNSTLHVRVCVGVWVGGASKYEMMWHMCCWERGSGLGSVLADMGGHAQSAARYGICL
jgi:hypothetical protein